MAESSVSSLNPEQNELTANLSGPDLCYWVAKANTAGHAQERNVIRSHYGHLNKNDPSAEPAMRTFVFSKLGATLPPRGTWP